jgi:hypothetical protein
MEAEIYTPFGRVSQPGKLFYEDTPDYTLQAKKYLGIHWVRASKKSEWITAQGMRERGYKVKILD